MEQLSPGQIYLADHRGLAETNTYRRYSTFNYGDYRDSHKAAFGNLAVFNDEIIAAGQKIELTVKESCFVVIIPITGMVTIKIKEGITHYPDAGEVFVNYADAGTIITFENTYDSDWVNFLYLEIGGERGSYNILPSLFSFDPAEKQNNLVEAVAGPEKFPFAINMGMFQGREETIYKVRSEQSKLFSFIISGAFELQGRLMHERDGLALWDLQEADMEALSNNAVIMLLELY